MLISKIKEKKTGILTYGITPPKKNHPEEKIIEITEKHISRIKNLNIDGLVIYDLQDESDRTSSQRPFPFIETIDSYCYAKEYLSELNISKIVYRCVGKYNEIEISNFLENIAIENIATVFVGAASKKQNVTISLKDAYNILQNKLETICLGGVTIPERHSISNDEHLRVIKKINSGCSFFISQAVYNKENAKNFLSDYHYECIKNNSEKVPILITLSPCGSSKTLDFMEWLGIDVPKWIKNELHNTNDILETSVNHCINIAKDLLEFGTQKNIPIGFNIESVSVRKVEIEASIKLTEEIKKLLK